MVQVIFIWKMVDVGDSRRSMHVAWLPECPAVGSTVHVPLNEPDHRGRTDLENSAALTVWHVAWTDDGTGHWHAEVHLK